MLHNAASANNTLFALSARLADVTDLDGLLDAIVEYPRSRGASAVAIYRAEGRPRFQLSNLTMLAEWSMNGQLSEPGILEDAQNSFESLFDLGQSLLILSNTDGTSSPAIDDSISRFFSLEQDSVCILIPLIVNQSPIGLIHLRWKTSYSVTEADTQIFTIIGQQVAWIMYGITMHADMQLRTRRAELLLQLSTNVSQASDEEEILKAIASVVTRYNVDTLTLFYINIASLDQPSTITIVARWSRQPDAPLPRQVRLGVPRSMPGFLNGFVTGNPPDEAICIEDLRTLTQEHDPGQIARTDFNHATAVLIPLWRDGWQGLLFLNWTNPHVITEDEKYIYSSLIQLVSPLIASRRAFLSQEAAWQESEQRAKELETVSKVSAAASQNLEFEQLLQTVVDLSKSSFNLYNAHIYLLDTEGKNLLLAATSGETGKAMKSLGVTRLVLLRDPSIAARCGRTKDGIIVNDVSKSPDFIPNPLLPEVRSEMAVPMILGDSLIGVLNLQSKEINRFTPNVLLVMQALANEIAVAVRNVHLFEEQLRVAEEFRVLDKLKTQFLANMSHELRTPLNAILNFTYFVASGLFGTINEKQVDALGKVTHGATHLLGLINDILDFTKIEAGMMQLFWQDVDLNVVLETIIATANGLTHAEDVNLIVDIEPNLPMIRADKQRIRQIVLNLLSNALKFTQNGSVTLTVRLQERNILLSVTDTGPGIAPEDHETVFEAFRQSTEGLRRGGTGLGLPISRRLAEAHGGTLSVSSQLNVGSTFLVTLPLDSQEPIKPNS